MSTKTIYKEGHQPHWNTTHGMSRSPEYQAWNHLQQRCTNPDDPSYPRYGGRGVSVCPKWAHSFDAFLADMGSRPGDGYSIERVDKDGNYEPGNCVWADAKAQARNRSNNRVIEVNGVAKPLAEWAEQAGISRQTLRMRLERGWPIADALITPVQFRTKGK
jgi:hypothetical protein